MATQGKAEDSGKPKADNNLIEALPVSELRRTARGGASDPGVEKLRAKELDYIKLKRPGASAGDLAGLALSGGGIRSASFALGVMQALAKKGVLTRMDYLSTVSGGGYIGSALTWLLGKHNRGAGFGLDKDNFPFGHDSGRKSTETQGAMLDWLRQHGKYLTPGKGITLMSGIAVVLRGILLNLIVWVPVGIAAFLMLFPLATWIADGLAGLSGSVGWLFGVLAALLPADMDSSAASLFLSALAVSVAILLALSVGSVVYSFVTWICVSPGKLRYGFRRWAEAVAGHGFWIAIGGAVLASIPLVGVSFDGWTAAAGGPLSAAVGIVTGIWGFLRSLRGGPKALSGLAATAGAALLIYGLALICFGIALDLADSPLSPAWNVYWIFLGIAVGTGILVNINYISIHLFYRDRLMETFLPDVESALNGETGPAHAANKVALDDVLAPETPVAPYQLINANVVLVNSRDHRRRLRGGDSFVLTPHYCGSTATGWRPTDSLIKGRFTLATAMAISGAAANPNAGSAGVGVTRNRAVSLLMSLLNLRLGYWVPNPRRGCRWFSPNHFVPGLVQTLGGRFGFHREDACYVELSDGGHFENLALYELIRRRLKLIILCDGAADPKFGFSDLNSLRRRVAADFGARIVFEPGPEPDKLMPERLKHSAPDNAGYAVDADMAETGHLQGQIDYADGTTGALVYLKTTMVKTVSFGVKAYKGAHHDFPDETTADQFFDEEQFDAYRELGRHLGQCMLDESELADKLDEVIAKGAW